MPRFQLEGETPVILSFACSHSESPESVKCEPPQPGQGNQSFRLALCIVRPTMARQQPQQGLWPLTGLMSEDF